jgi:Protein of unknown function (DUF2971)
MSIPTHLYKYRSLSGEKSRDRTRKEIVDTEVYFPCCKQFNDPFDCRLNVRGDFSADDRRQMDTATESAGILCLSECNDSLLMWSHYADVHRGVCIEYSTSKDRLFGCSVDRVSYASVYPKMSLADTPDLGWVRKYLSTKSDHWEYEKEWRIFYHSIGVNFAPPEELSAVILGCMMSSQDRDAVCEWVASRSMPTRLYEARRDDGAFRIQIVPFRSEA